MTCMPLPAAYSLLYDRDCRICTAFARTARRLDVRGALTIRAIQDSGEMLQGLPTDRWFAAAHAVDPDGRVTSGGEALPAILAALVAGPRFESRVRESSASMAALRWGYGVMAEVRGRLTCAAGPVSAARIPE